MTEAPPVATAYWVIVYGLTRIRPKGYRQARLCVQVATPAACLAEAQGSAGWVRRRPNHAAGAGVADRDYAPLLFRDPGPVELRSLGVCGGPGGFDAADSAPEVWQPTRGVLILQGPRVNP